MFLQLVRLLSGLYNDIRRKPVAVYTGCLLLFITVSCGGVSESNRDMEPPQDAQTHTVTGRISDVKSSSFFGIDSLTLADDRGVKWEFEGRDIVIPEFSPSHLRDHMLGGQPIVVEYRRDGESLVIVGISDGAE